MASAEAPAPGGTTGRLFQGVARNEFGFKMLQSMGWSEGQGLGAAGNGITKHIAAVRRQDQIGIGADMGCDTSAKVDWCANTQNFDQILAGLQSVGATEAAPRKKKKDKKRGKDKSGSTSKIMVAAPARGRPQGRYAKREAGKMVKGYSQEDLNMILGVAPTDAFVALPAMTRAQQSSSSDSSDGEDVAAKAREKKRRREHLPAAATAKQPSAKSASVAPPPAEEDHEEEEEGYTAPPAGWWGASMFRWAGRLGGVRRATKQAKGFCEDDQVDAYNNVHDHATHGKQGLGIRDAPKKVAGARWAGTKVSFGDGADTGGVDEDAGDEEGCDAAIAATLRKIKWKKLAEAALRARPTGASTLKALRRDVLAAAGVSGAKPLRVAAEVALSRRLLASRRFAVEGDAVRLVAGTDDDGADD